MPTGAAGVSTKWHGLIVEYNWIIIVNSDYTGIIDKTYFIGIILRHNLMI